MTTFEDKNPLRIDSHGSSRWADFEDLRSRELVNGEGMTFGHVTDQADNWEAVNYTGDAHMITKAPTRGGKGTTQIIPSLMDHTGGVLCIDPKGENAIITAQFREQHHGQKVAIFDPWNVACQHLDRDADCFNPLDMLDADEENLADDSALIADALIMPEKGGDSHWSGEAKAMCTAFIVHLVTSPKEDGNRHLGRLRDILSLPPNEFQSLVMNMSENGHPLAMSGANRIMQKSDRELSAVISTAQQNTHFLESPRVKKSLSKSTFDFKGLRDDDKALSAFVVLPADRLGTHGRLLRLMVSMAITDMVRAPKKPKQSALFVLDEFAALGKLSIIEQAFGLMAGFGMQIHAIVQDFNQLYDLYGQRWQTFVANAGVIQAFGTRDLFSAEYVSKMAGMTTVEVVSEDTAKHRTGSGGEEANPTYRSMKDQVFGRNLILPEEVMQLGQHEQLLFLPNCPPLRCLKVPYYRNAKYFDTDGKPLFNPHPNYGAPTRAPMAFDTITATKRGQKIKEIEPETEVKKGWFKR